MSWNVTALKRALQVEGRTSGLIKGEVAEEPSQGLYPGFSASGQDVWLQQAQFSGPGLILSAVGARCGKVFESPADREWGTVANTVVLLPRPGYDAHFLWYLVNNEDFWEKGGAAQPYVRVAETLERRLPLPPFHIQRAIADYLDAETARIDALIEKKQRLGALLQERRQALISQAILRNRDPGAATRGDAVGVDWRRLKHFCSVTCEYGVNVSSDDYASEGIRLIRTTDVNEDGTLTGPDGAVFIDPAFADGKLLSTGDLLFSRSGTIGRCLLFQEAASPCTFAGYLVRFRVRPDVDPRYVAYCSKANFFTDQIKSDAIESTISNFNAEKYGNVRLPWWTGGDQRVIADYLDRETARIDGLIERIGSQTRLLQEHRQTLITAAVTGELEVPGVAA